MLKLSERLDCAFPLPQSHRGFKPSQFIQTLILMQHEGSEFIQQCEKSLPEGCRVDKLRIDAVGYQKSIIRYCDDHQIDYAIRAKMSASVKAKIEVLSESDWMSLLDKQGEPIKKQQTYRDLGLGNMLHFFGFYIG